MRALALTLVAVAACCSGPAGADATPRRIVSLNPSLTSIVLALGAGDRLVGVDVFSAQQHPELAHLPTVGGLYNPSLEGLVAVAPDLVVLVPSAEQRDFRARLAELEVPVRSFDPRGFEEVVDSVAELGRLLGASQAARARIARIRAAQREVARAVAGLPRPRVVLVLQREPLFVVGSGNFIDEMLRTAGAENLGARLDDAYPRVSVEWLVAGRPEVILDASGDATEPQKYWSRWPSLPAVRARRVQRLPVGVATLPGPHLDRALHLLARSLHGDALALQQDSP